MGLPDLRAHPNLTPLNDAASVVAASGAGFDFPEDARRSGGGGIRVRPRSSADATGLLFYSPALVGFEIPDTAGAVARRRLPIATAAISQPFFHLYLFAVSEDHSFRISPPVGSVWEFGNEKIDGLAHFSRFPEELPRRCIEAYGKTGADVLVFDPFSGSGTTGIAALKLGCSYIGFEIEPEQAAASNERLRKVLREDALS